MKKEYITGSRYFFEGMPGFQSKDKDKIIITDVSPIPSIKFNKSMIIRGGEIDNYYFRPMTSDEWIDFTLDVNVPMAVARFLNKEFCSDFGITFEQLERLRSLVENMDDKHIYLKYIYETILKNRTWDLSNDELEEAHKIYKSKR